MTAALGTVVIDEHIFPIDTLILADGAFRFSFTGDVKTMRPWAGTEQLYVLNDPQGNEVYLGRINVTSDYAELEDNTVVVFHLDYRCVDKVTEGAKRLLAERNLRAG